MAKYVRLRSYLSGKFTGCEHFYLGDDHVKALVWFHREYPEHLNCNVVAETVDSEDDKFSKLIAVARRCGCVHPF